MADPRRLVLVVDYDNDLGEKARVRAPLVGRASVLDGAAKLSLADPTDSDANTMFEAVRQMDELSKEYGSDKVDVACITGSARLGFEADRELVRQLEHVISKTGAQSCVFVSDGASDDQLIPVVQSRIKIDAVKTVVIKQQKELEKTYFIILDKLKEPAFARVIFGIPGIALFLYFWLGGEGLRLFIGLLGFYLILKAFGVEERILRSISEFEFSFERIGFIFNFAAVPLLIASAWLGVSKVLALSESGTANVAKLAAYFTKDTLLLAPIALLLIVTGDAVESIRENRSYNLPSHVISASAIVLLWMVFTSAADWVIGTIPFGEFFSVLLLAVLAMMLVAYLAFEFKKSIVRKLPLAGKEVYTEVGGLLGRVVGVTKRGNAFEVKTTAGKTIDFAFNHIASLGDKIVIKY
jgi:putative membrane protein